MHISNRAVSTLAALLAACLLAPASPDARPLEEELGELLETNPEVRSQRAALEATRQEIDRAFAGYLPQVDLDGSIGPVYTDTEQRNTLGLPPFEKVESTAGATVTQNVFNGFETPSQVHIARANTEVAKFTLDSTRQEILLAGVDAYLDVLLQRRLVELARLNEESIKLQANLEDERVTRGAGIAVDVLQAKARLQIAKEERVAFEGDFQNAISRYIQVFDRAPRVSEMGEPAPPEPMLPRTVEEAVQIALHENPAIGSSLSTVEVASERRRLSRVDFYPRIDIVGEASIENDFDLREGQRTDLSLVVQATWNLFNGFRTSSTAAQAAYDYRASQENHEVVSRSVVEATRVSWQELQTARERQDLLANAVVIAEEALAARRRLREQGKETVINVLLAEDEVNNARINLARARYDALSATYAILQSVGRLDANVLGLRSE